MNKDKKCDYCAKDSVYGMGVALDEGFVDIRACDEHKLVGFSRQESILGDFCKKTELEDKKLTVEENFDKEFLDTIQAVYSNACQGYCSGDCDCSKDEKELIDKLKQFIQALIKQEREAGRKEAVGIVDDRIGMSDLQIYAFSQGDTLGFQEKPEKLLEESLAVKMALEILKGQLTKE